MAEFHQMLDGALWREERLRELLAWHAMHVYAASGNKPKSGGVFTMDFVLGRAHIPGPHYQPPEPEPEPVAAPEADPLASPPPPKTVDPLTIRLEQLAKRGFQVTRVQ